MTLGKYLSGVLALLSLGVPALAQDKGEDFLKFSGFGTLGGAHSSEKNADFTSTAVQPDGTGFSRVTSYSIDKKVGLQANAHIAEWLSAVVQGVSEYRYDGTFNPYINMAFLKAQVLPELSIRAGRMPFNAYLISDYQKVGYTYTWVRPPVEVYQFNPIFNYDGADITWQKTLGGVAFTVQAFAGSNNVKLVQRGAVTDLDAKELVGAWMSANHGNSLYRIYYLQGKLTANNPALNVVFNQIRNGIPPLGLPGNPALASQLELQDDRVTYMSVGYQYDPGNWFITAEAARNGGDENAVIHATAAYITGGYRLCDWTPYLTVAQRKNDSPTTNPNPIANALLSGGNRADQSFSVGLRWDFMKNMDLKIQYDQFKNDTNAYGALSNNQPAFQKGQSYSVITANLDFVF
ncbi:hypothetical protein GETHLI_20610 [Geothrix limicola]|uniref:Porin n=1 Tax=Geothrix limicola TaxID=2927978 RepID=A0ABQ5QHN9_9BACT|nr:hypothetical protein [Geothrix limicola]GLH73559.1 hypothetical protein GETHLI_20610 [Geothrix limicola]